MPDNPRVCEVETAAFPPGGRDMSAGQKMVGALMGDSDKLRILFHEARDGIFVLDQDGRVKEANLAFARMLGRPPEEMIGLCPWDWDLTYSREQVLTNIPTMASTEIFETRIRRTDSTVFDAEISSSSIEADGEKFLFMVCRDVTQRKQAERALRESEQRLRTMGETEPECVKLLAPNGDLLEMNPAGLKMLEASSLAELQARSLLELIVPEHRAAFIDLHQRVMTGETAKLEFETVGLKGTRRWLETHAAPMRDASGAVTAALGITRDITERRQAEAASRESAARLRMAVQAGNIGLWDWDMRTDRVYYSREWKAQLGYGDEDAFETLSEWESRLHPDDHSRMMDVTKGFLANPGLGYRSEFRLRHKDGSYRWIAAQGAVLRDEHGRPQRVLGSHVEITALKQAEEMHRETQARFTSFMNASPAIAWIKDRSGRFVYLNKAWGDAFGLRTEDWIGKTTFDRQPFDIAERLWKNDLAVFEAGKPMEFTEETVEGNGKRILWRSFKFPFVAASGERLIGGIAIDITRQREMEDQLRQSQKLEAVGQLTGGVAHDFNNLLAIIIGNLEILQEVGGFGTDGSPEIRAAIRASQRGAELTQRLLAFSRHQALAPRPVHVNALVKESTVLFKRTLGESIRIQAVVGTGLDLALVDPGQLENALLNLAVNARDAMPQGGDLTVETGQVTVSEGDLVAGETAVPGSYVTIFVRDTGTGMTPEVLARAFDPFYTTKDVGKGSGLGLSMVYGFVKQSNGYIEIESTPGKGTTVALYLPSALSIAEDEDEVLHARKPGHGERIAVIEDDPGVRATIIEQLKRLGYDARSFGDGREIMARLGEFGDIDLLLSDIVLPGGCNGISIAKAVRRAHPGIRLLFMSGYAEELSAMEKIDALDATMITKPFTREQLSLALRGAFQSERRRELAE